MKRRRHDTDDGEVRVVDANRAADDPAVRVDYIELVDWITLEPLEIAGPETLFAVAAYVGSTRLIDNTILG